MVEAVSTNLCAVAADFAVGTTTMADVPAGVLADHRGQSCCRQKSQVMSAHVSDSSDSSITPRRRRWRWVGLFFLGSLAAGIWFAPEIVSQTSLRQSVVNWATKDLGLRIVLGPNSLSWTKPVVLRELQVRDTEGNALLEVKELRSERTLWQLVTQQTVLGTFTLIEPTGHVVLRADGSNVEDVLATLLSGPTSEPAPDIRVEIVNARVEFEHPASHQKSAIESLDMKLSTGAKGLQLFVAEMPSKSAEKATDSGRLAAYFGRPVGNSEKSDAASTNSDGDRQLLVRAQDWRMDWLSPILARWQPQGALSGQLSGDWRMSLGSENAGNGSVTVSDLNIAGLNGMGADRLRLDEVTLRGNVAMTEDRLILEDTELRTEVGSLTASGDLPLSGWSLASGEEALRKLGREAFRVDGEVDLAKLAALLPQTLAVREGTRIDGGSVQVSLASQPQGSTAKFQGKVEVARLSAVSEGKRIEWNVPLEASLIVHRDGEQFVFDRVTCRSDFLQADAKGTLTDATFQARADLDRLQHNPSRFFDWGLVRLSGQLEASGQIQRRDGGELNLSATGELTNFELQRRGESPWREAQLEIVAASTARLSEKQQLRSVESASLRLVSGSDRLDVKLTEPIEWSSNSHWRIVADVVGGLDSWQARLRPVLTVEGWQVAGHVAAHTEVESDSRMIDVSKLNVAINDLQARGPEWLIQEPKLTLETAGRWESAAGRWIARQTILTGTSAAATVSNLDWSPDGASGDARFRVHLGNISRWKVQAQQQPTYFVTGEATGSVRLQQNGTTTQATFDSQVEKFSLATPNDQAPSGWETAWKEPEIKLATQASFDSAKQSLRLSETKLIADGLEVDLAGRLNEWNATPVVDISGEVAYDWDRLTQRLGESLRQNVQLTGQERRKFALRGRLSSPEVAARSTDVDSRGVGLPTSPLGAGLPTPSRTTQLSTISRTSSPSNSSLAALTGEAGLGWQTANLYGLSAGAGSLSCQMSEGVGALVLRDLSVNEGTVRLNSQLRLDRTPALIVLQSDRVIDKVRLSPELCAGWLRFVAPLMANATRVEGRFSVVLAKGALPVSDPSTGEVSGQFAIHEAKLSPGPLTHQVLAVVDRVKSLTKSRSLKPADLLSLVEPSASTDARERVLVTMPEQQVPFHLIDGRVHHEGLTFVTKEATLKTRGSVGLDESLDLIIDVPVRDEWVAQNKQLANLRGKSLSIPVRGSLVAPQLDLRVFEILARDTLTAPVENLLENELQKGLNRFLPSKKK